MKTTLRYCIAGLALVVVLGSCTSSTSTSTPSLTLVDSLAGVWNVTEVGVSGDVYGVKPTEHNTFVFVDTITRANDSAISVKNSFKTWWDWHFQNMTYWVGANKRAIAIPGSTVSGRIITIDSFVIGGEDVTGGWDTHFTGYYGRKK